MLVLMYAVPLFAPPFPRVAAAFLQVVFDAELGLAVESLPGGASTQSLWNLL